MAQLKLKLQALDAFEQRINAASMRHLDTMYGLGNGVESGRARVVNNQEAINALSLLRLAAMRGKLDDNLRYMPNRR